MSIELHQCGRAGQIWQPESYRRQRRIRYCSPKGDNGNAGDSEQIV